MSHHAGLARLSSLVLARAKGEQALLAQVLVDVKIAVVPMKTVVGHHKERIVRPQLLQNQPQRVIQHVEILIRPGIKCNRFLP